MRPAELVSADRQLTRVPGRFVGGWGNEVDQLRESAGAQFDLYRNIGRWREVIPFAVSVQLSLFGLRIKPGYFD